MMTWCTISVGVGVSAGVVVSGLATKMVFEAMHEQGDTVREAIRQAELWCLLNRRFENERVQVQMNHNHLQMLKFFRTVGLLTRQGLLEKDLAKQVFSRPFTAYFKACSSYVHQHHQEKPEEYKDVLYLYGLWGEDPTLKTPRELLAFWRAEEGFVEAAANLPKAIPVQLTEADASAGTPS